MLLLIRAKWESQGVPPTSYYLIITLIMIYYFSPLIKKLVEFLVNLTNEVVQLLQLLQPILICLKAKEREEQGEDRRRSILRFAL
jgi:hypothetical protein